MQTLMRNLQRSQTPGWFSGIGGREEWGKSKMSLECREGKKEREALAQPVEGWRAAGEGIEELWGLSAEGGSPAR